MGEPRDRHTKWSQRQILRITYGIYIQNRSRLADIENKLLVTKGERDKGKDKLGVWDEQNKLPYIK